MDRVPSKDIERMIAFINHEADEKIKEMKIRATQEYNAEKARIIKEETSRIENGFLMKQKEIEKKRLMAESSLANTYKQKYLEEKVRILDEIYNEVLRVCSKKPLNLSLMAQCIEKMDGKEFIVYCNKKDKKVVEKEHKSAEVREMVPAGVGGVLLCSKDYSTIVDNSFASRLETIRGTFEAEINKAIFKCFCTADLFYRDLVSETSSLLDASAGSPKSALLCCSRVYVGNASQNVAPLNGSPIGSLALTTSTSPTNDMLVISLFIRASMSFICENPPVKNTFFTLYFRLTSSIISVNPIWSSPMMEGEKTISGIFRRSTFAFILPMKCPLRRSVVSATYGSKWGSSSFI
ncbi:vacuolar ATP synthase subunit E-like protein [Encephalitozoon cuniculi EcunIII-L]|nr:vacuolar ATP synthase subunit E-like protein [Encephalitozoon cuniculi EcunIII-L]UYI27829.1 vacuolar ATP synthase subunit E [Encephalitozoon cuniculi]